jgi:hypothetical protein
VGSVEVVDTTDVAGVEDTRMEGKAVEQVGQWVHAKSILKVNKLGI